MKRISKSKHGELADLDKQISDAHEKLGDVINTYNEAVVELQEARDAYNDAIQQARDTIEEITGEIESYYEERSERWQEGEAGDAYDEWRQEWADAGLDLKDYDESPDELSEPDQAPALTDLTAEPSA